MRELKMIIFFSNYFVFNIINYITQFSLSFLENFLRRKKRVIHRGNVKL